MTVSWQVLCSSKLKGKQIIVSISLWNTQHSFMFIPLRFFFPSLLAKEKRYNHEINFLLFFLFYITCALSFLSSFLSKDLECIVTPAGAVTVVELCLNGAPWALRMTQITVSRLLPLIAWSHLASGGWPQWTVFMPTMARPRNLGLKAVVSLP